MSTCSRCKRREPRPGFKLCERCVDRARRWYDDNRRIPVDERQGMRRKVHDLRAEGLSTLDIARKLNTAHANVFYHLRREPDATMRNTTRSDAGTSANRCTDCGTILASGSVAGRRCRPCRQSALDEERDARIEALRNHASAIGRVPTVTEAAVVLGIGRSRAGDLVRLAFGADDRRGAKRRAPREVTQ